MANWFQHLLLAAVLIVFGSTTVFAEDNDPVIDPGIDPKAFKVAKIDDEFFEVGVSVGLISVEDFGAVPIVGASATFHATEDLFIQASGGFGKVGISSVELALGEGIRLLSEDERQYLYYEFMVGLNVLPGETFITRKFAFKSTNYIVAGIGNTQFAGDNNFTYVAGLGYKLVLTDFLTWQYDIRDHMFYTELLGEPKFSHNFELSSGLNFFF